MSFDFLVFLVCELQLQFSFRLLLDVIKLKLKLRNDSLSKNGAKLGMQNWKNNYTAKYFMKQFYSKWANSSQI